MKRAIVSGQRCVLPAFLACCHVVGRPAGYHLNKYLRIMAGEGALVCSVIRPFSARPSASPTQSTRRQLKFCVEGCCGVVDQSIKVRAGEGICQSSETLSTLTRLPPFPGCPVVSLPAYCPLCHPVLLLLLLVLLHIRELARYSPRHVLMLRHDTHRGCSRIDISLSSLGISGRQPRTPSCFLVPDTRGEEGCESRSSFLFVVPGQHNFPANPAAHPFCPAISTAALDSPGLAIGYPVLQGVSSGPRLVASTLSIGHHGSVVPLLIPAFPGAPYPARSIPSASRPRLLTSSQPP